MIGVIRCFCRVLVWRRRDCFTFRVLGLEFFRLVLLVGFIVFIKFELGVSLLVFKGLCFILRFYLDFFGVRGLNDLIVGYFVFFWV